MSNYWYNGTETDYSKRGRSRQPKLDPVSDSTKVYRQHLEPLWNVHARHPARLEVTLWVLGVVGIISTLIDGAIGDGCSYGACTAESKINGAPV